LVTWFPNEMICFQMPVRANFATEPIADATFRALTKRGAFGNPKHREISVNLLKASKAGFGTSPR
jgi:hypothetical protein